MQEESVGCWVDALSQSLEICDGSRVTDATFFGLDHFPKYAPQKLYIFCLLKKIYYFIYFIFREGKGGEREGKKHQCVVASGAPLTGDLACNPGMCPDQESNQPPFGLQAGTQSTEPHQPGLNVRFLDVIRFSERKSISKSSKFGKNFILFCTGDSSCTLAY